MKIRNGFVSNSSSSSFIIGYGIIKDKNKFNKYTKENNLSINKDYYGLKVIDQNNYDCEEYNILSSENYKLVGGNDTNIDVPKELISEGDVVFIEITNDEGDENFYDYVYGELDYSPAKDISFYSEEQQKIINLFYQDFITKSNILFGAERNG